MDIAEQLLGCKPKHHEGIAWWVLKFDLCETLEELMTVGRWLSSYTTVQRRKKWKRRKGERPTQYWKTEPPVYCEVGRRVLVKEYKLAKERIKDAGNRTEEAPAYNSD